MKKILIISMIILSVYALQLAADEIIDKPGEEFSSNKIQMIIPDEDIQNDDIETGNGIHRVYWSKNSLKTEGTVRNGMKEGEWTIFFEDSEGKIIRAKGSYLKNNLHGQWITYYKDGRVQSRQTYLHGKLNGIYYQFSENGVPIAEITFKKGIKNGVYKQYYPDGKPKEISMYANDIKHGTENLFYPNGKRISIGIYQNGARDGLWKFFHDNGKRKYLGRYKNGKKTGQWKIFDENDKQISVSDF